MNFARKQSTLVSNPSAVMRMIESADPSRGLTALMPATFPPVPVSVRSSETILKLHVDLDQSDSVDDVFQLDVAPNRQVEQLVQHLRNRHKELAQREADLQAKTYHWDKQELATQAAFRKRNGELEQHLSQVHAQQTQLLKLQQSLVDSQTAIRCVVEKLVSESDQAERTAQLKSLRDELCERFDYNFRQWERLAEGW